MESKTIKLVKAKSKVVVTRDWGPGGGKSWSKGYKVSNRRKEGFLF